MCLFRCKGYFGQHVELKFSMNFWVRGLAADSFLKLPPPSCGSGRQVSRTRDQNTNGAGPNHREISIQKLSFALKNGTTA